MIFERTMYSCKCDMCGEEWADSYNGYVAFTDKSSILEYVKDDGWLASNKKQYCRDCWGYDNNDEIVILKTKIRKLKLKNLKNL